MASSRATGARFDYERFLNIRSAYGPSFTHDGRVVAFVSNITGVPQAFAVPLLENEPRTSGAPYWPEQLTFTQDRIGAIFPSQHDDRAIVTTDVGGDERFQLVLLDDGGATVRALTTNREAMYHFGGWSPDGRQIAFVSNERDPRFFDVYVRDLNDGQARCVAQTDVMFSVHSWSPDGQRLLAVRIESNSESVVYEVTLKDGNLRRLTPDGERALWVAPEYTPDGRSVVLTTNFQRDTLALVRLELQSGAVEPLVESEWDVEEAALSPNGRMLAYALNADGYSELYVRDLADNKTRRADVPRGVIALGRDPRRRDVLAWSPGSARLAFSLATARHTRNVHVLSVGQHDPATQERPTAATQVTAATQAAIPPERLVEPQLVRYPSFDGRQIPAFLYPPHGAAPDGSHPALIIFHGGPESQVRPELSADVQYFAQSGYVVLTPNVRGSTGYGKAYQALDDVERRMDSVADGKAAADWLASSGWANARKIACMGGSYGGFMTLACLCTYPDTWAAGVDLFGIANFVTFMENTHPFRRRHRAAEYGSLEEHRDVLERISPLRYADRITAPLLAIHGERDPRVPIGETEQIVEALGARGVPADFIRFADEGHGIVKLPNRLQLYPQIAAFLDRYLR